MQRRCGEHGKDRADERGGRFSLYLLEISLVLAFIAAACIPTRCLCFGLPADVYDADICFGGSLLCDAGAKKARRDFFASFYTSVAVTRYEDGPGSLRSA